MEIAVKFRMTKNLFVIEIRLIFDHEKCKGCIIITNLRFIWHAAQYQKINLCKFKIYSLLKNEE